MAKRRFKPKPRESIENSIKRFVKESTALFRKEQLIYQQIEALQKIKRLK